MNKKGLLIVISGPSGVGKGTICKDFLEKNKEVDLSVSFTTRRPREGEVDGVNYNFIDIEEFKKKIEQNDLLEYANVHDNYYGTPKSYVEKKLEEGIDVILEIDPKGAIQVKEKFNQGVFIFLLPPKLLDLKHRIEKRGTENKSDIEKRYKNSIGEINQIKEYDYFVVNDDINETVKSIEHIIESEKLKVSRNMSNLKKKFKEVFKNKEE